MSYCLDRGYLVNTVTGELQHREVMADILEYLEAQAPHIKWMVHHKDGNRQNNERSNLLVLSMNAHMALHNPRQYVDEEKRIKTIKERVGYKHTEKSKFKMRSKQIGKYRGTVYNKYKNPEKRCWNCAVTFNYNKTSLGYFEDPISAEIVYKFVVEQIELME